MSGDLRLKDFRRAYLLAGECSELGGNPRAWQGRLIEGLCSLLGAQVGLSTLLHPPRGPDRQPRMELFIEPPWTSRRQREISLYYWKHHWYRTDPSVVAFSRLRGPVLARRRTDLVDARTWDRSAHRERIYGPGGMENFMAAGLYPDARLGLPPQTFLFMRPTEDAAFSERDRLLAALLCREIRSRLGTRLRPVQPAMLPGLSPRARQVLDLLLAGFSEKEAAARLGISAHTAHDYVKALHRHFGVGSRIQLYQALRSDGPAIKRS